MSDCYYAIDIKEVYWNSLKLVHNYLASATYRQLNQANSYGF